MDFKLLESHFAFIVPEGGDLDFKELFQSYSIDIDFGIGENGVKGEIQLITMIELNSENDNQYPGYKIMVEGGGTFRIQDPENLEENLKKNLTQFSTLNMMINNLRNIRSPIWVQWVDICCLRLISPICCRIRRGKESKRCDFIPF